MKREKEGRKERMCDRKDKMRENEKGNMGRMELTKKTKVGKRKR